MRAEGGRKGRKGRKGYGSTAADFPIFHSLGPVRLSGWLTHVVYIYIIHLW